MAGNAGIDVNVILKACDRLARASETDSAQPAAGESPVISHLSV